MKINIIKIINLPVSITNNEFHTTNFCVSPTGYYFLDSVNRQVAYLSNNGGIIFAGGYGIDNDAFIDPIEILNSKLRVWIIDRTENKLIEFDHKLNYLRTIEFDQIYPEFSGIDDWGNILLQSKQEQKILKANPPIQNFDDFIDLSMWNGLTSCITDFHVAFDGTLGILSVCNNSVNLFNRLGKLEKIFPIENTDGRFLIKLSDKWFVISTEGQITSIRHNEKVNLLIEQPILDVAQMNSILYILLLDKIWVVDVSME
ncbi:MAG: hypothetical protein GWP19_10190 [Planctomycetia bacterium]|nr:hypothetical protein [Planctomycetia bacterium]